MAYEIPGQKNGQELASADLSAKQFAFCVLDATGVNVAGAGVRAFGVLQNKPKAGEAAEVMVTGISKVKCGAAIAHGALVESDANGAAITRTTGVVVGQCVLATIAAGEIASVLLIPNA